MLNLRAGPLFVLCVAHVAVEGAGNEPKEKPMQNKTSMLLGAAAVALGAGVGIADPFDNVRHDPDRPVCTSDSSCDQNGTAFRNGYSYGYEDGIARRQQRGRNGAGVKDNDDPHRVAQGSYYLINSSFNSGDSWNFRP